MAVSLLVLTDFFQPANHALDYAVALAGPLGARLVLLHVHRDSVLDPELLTGKLANLDTEAIDSAFARLTHNLPVPVVSEVAHGQVGDAIATAVRHHHPVLIVLGRSDTENTPEELISTTALDLLRTAPYPMLVVPRKGPVLPARRLLLAVDGEPFTLGEQAGAVRHLFATLHAELTVLCVAEHATSKTTADEVLDSVQRTGLTTDLPQSIGFRAAVASHPATGILHVAQPDEYDMVVLFARPRSFWGELFRRSVTAQVLLRSAVPVLVLPTTA